MEKLSYIELLCLRVSEGLGSERDIQRLEKAGIDPKQWLGLSDVLRTALAPPPIQEVVVGVCQEVGVEALPIQAALAPQSTPNLVMGVAEAIGFDVAPATPIVADPILESPEISLDAVEEPPAAVLPEEESEEEEEFSPEGLAAQEKKNALAEALAPAHIPNLMHDIMSQILPQETEEVMMEDDSGEIFLEEDSGEIILTQQEEVPTLALVSSVEEDDDSDEVFVLETIIAEPEMEEEEFVQSSLAQDWEDMLGEALSPSFTPDMSDWIMTRVGEVGVPSSHLRLVSGVSGEDIEEPLSNTYSERVGDVDVEIQDISSPRVIDGDSAAGTWSLVGMLLLAAAAAIFVVNQVIGESPYEGSSVVENAEVAQSAEILEVTSDDHIQIQSDGSMTIIFINVGEE